MEGFSFSEMDTHPLRFVLSPFEWLCLEFWVPSVGTDIHFTPQVSVPIWERLGEIWNPQQQNKHTHTLSHSSPSGVFSWHPVTADRYHRSRGVGCSNPTLFPLLSLPSMSEVEAKASLPHTHLPPPLVVWEEWRWLMCSGGSVGVEPGSSSALAQSWDLKRTHQSRNRSWQGQMMKSSPSNDPHPRRGWLRVEEKEEERLKGGVRLFQELSVWFMVAAKLSYFSRDAFGYSVMKTYSRHVSTQISGCNTESAESRRHGWNCSACKETRGGKSPLPAP